MNISLFEKISHNKVSSRANTFQVFKIGYYIWEIFLDRINSVYNELYRKFDFDTSPFGYDMSYIMWRKSKINEKIILYLKKGRILDDGGGYGFLYEFLRDSNNKYEYYNLDCSFEMLKYDKSMYRCLGQGEALPFKDENFDAVVSGDVLEHTQDKIMYLYEAYRVLKRGGIFVLNTPRTGWRRSYLTSFWFWIPLLSDFYSSIKEKNKKETPSFSLVPDLPSNETWLENQLKSLGYDIMVQSRTDNHLFVFTHRFWRRFADIFIDPKKFGHCAFFVCRK